jgi:TonB family protein
VEKLDIKIKASELSKETQKVISSATENEVQNQSTATAPIAKKSEIKSKATETSKPKEEIKPESKEGENSFERIKPSVDRTNLKIRETVFVETDKKSETNKQAISKPDKESEIENQAVNSVSAITESINIEEILTKIEDEKSEPELLSESETYEKEIIRLQRKLRRNILVSAALFVIVVASSLFLYIKLQEAPVKVADKKNISEKINLAGQTNLVINNDYKAMTETENPEKINETLDSKETVIDEQVTTTAPSEVTAKEENKIFTPNINKNLASNDYTEPTQIAAAKTDNIVIPKENKKIEEEPSVFLAVEEMPELVGGIKGLQNKIVYPKIAENTGTEGRVLIQAVVDETGKVISANTIKGIGAGCDEVALDAVLNSKFKPGKQRGKNVKVQVTIPIVFKKQ